jgi:hypothetical protein
MKWGDGDACHTKLVIGLLYFLFPFSFSFLLSFSFKLPFFFSFYFSFLFTSIYNSYFFHIFIPFSLSSLVFSLTSILPFCLYLNNLSLLFSFFHSTFLCLLLYVSFFHCFLLLFLSFSSVRSSLLLTFFFISYICYSAFSFISRVYLYPSICLSLSLFSGFLSFILSCLLIPLRVCGS